MNVLKISLLSAAILACPSFKAQETQRLTADKLNEYDICVRSGLHCAPLVHKYLGTTCQGAIRVSFGCDNNQSEVAYFLSVLERILQEIKN